MRLSDAMMLGSVTCRMERYNWNSCAIGCAGNAIGIPNWGNVGQGRQNLLLQVWPWLLQPCHCAMCVAVTMNRENAQLVGWVETYCGHITSAFDFDVCQGGMSFEALVDWVRSVEPQPLALPAPVGMSVEVGDELLAAL